MNDDYIDEEDKTTTEDYLTPDEREEPVTDAGVTDDVDVAGDIGTTSDYEDEDNEVAPRKFDDEEPDINDIIDDDNPYPHP